MPYVSDETVLWANGVLAKGSFHALKSLFTTHPIVPPSGGINLAAVGLAGDLPFDYSKLKIGSAANSIKFIRLRPNEKNEIGAMTFVLKSPADLPTVASRVGWKPIWWLPWQSCHIPKIKIRSLATDPTIDAGVGIDPIPNPDLFVTAAINGCSVFAVGDTKFPSLYHGGVDGEFSVRDPAETTEEAWRRLLGRTNKNGKQNYNVQGVGKTDYISELDADATDVNKRFRYNGATTTRAAAALEQQLEQRGTLTNVMVSPWGMVFGLRDLAGDWTMTLVKNAFVRYHRIQLIHKKRVLSPDKVITRHVGEFRANRTYDGSGNLTSPPVKKKHLTEQAIQNCVSLGYQDFFPGRGAVTMHNLNQVNVY
jgi:hypothetical protein